MKYAMPVHPKVLEKDFESDEYVSDDIDRLMGLLSVKNSMSDFSKSDIEFVKSKIQSLWFLINLKRGINLRDREKLEPIFRELARIVKKQESPFYCYRGVRLSNFDPTVLSDHYDMVEYDVEFKPKHPGILNHLEGLAYGLRSWSNRYNDAIHWATHNKLKDRVIFRIKNPDIVLDTEPVQDFFDASRMFDPNEFILNIKNPSILYVKKLREKDLTYMEDDEDDVIGNLWEIEIKDN